MLVEFRRIDIEVDEGFECGFDHGFRRPRVGQPGVCADDQQGCWYLELITLSDECAGNATDDALFGGDWDARIVEFLSQSVGCRDPVDVAELVL